MVYGATGEGPHLVFYSNEPDGGFHNTYSFDDGNQLLIYNPQTSELLWSGSSKGKNRKALKEINCLIVPEKFPTKQAKDFVQWCVAEYPAILIGDVHRLKSWGDINQTIA